MLLNGRPNRLWPNLRNYLQLVSLAPNVSTGFSTQGQAGARQGGIRAGQTISVAGQRTNFNHYTIDGVENTDPNFNTFIVMPSVDAVQEFKVQTGVYPAEFGRQTTQINVLTKSGSNQYHGTMFEFLRNDKLDATTYAFTVLRPVKDPFKWNQYGFTLGGPVRLPKNINGKDKLFFMANYDSFRKRGNPIDLSSLALDRIPAFPKGFVVRHEKQFILTVENLRQPHRKRGNTIGLYSLAPAAFQNGDRSY